MTKKDFIKNSTELRCFRALMYFILGIYLFFTLILLIGILSDVTDLIAVLILITIFLGAFFIYFLNRCLYILKNFNNYEFMEVEFKEMHSGFFSNTLYFTVPIYVDGRIKKIDTRSIFTASSLDLISLNFEKYLNHKVKIAFNKVTEEIVVICPTDGESNIDL